MTRSARAGLTALAFALAACGGSGDEAPAPSDSVVAQAPDTVRVASFNMMLYREERGALIADLKDPDNAQIAALTEIVQRVRPEILLINEFDYDAEGEALALFQERWLSQGRNGAEPIAYEHSFLAPSNTGVPTGFDLDRDGSTDGPGDGHGFGEFPGQYAMAMLSKHPIARESVRTFREFLWKDMPEAMLPSDLDTEESGDWYSEEALEVLRLSSKSHWDLPIEVDGRRLHLLASHPTPPSFDGPENRNGRRNHDEIRFWADYIAPGRGDYIYDDSGTTGGLDEGERFVIAGDLNADPHDSGMPEAIAQLLEHPQVNASAVPTSAGGAEQAKLQGSANAEHRTPPEQDSSDFDDEPPGPGNLRLDYVLPSAARLAPVQAGVFWPESEDPLFRLVGTYPVVSSDHRLVWIDLRMTE